MRNAFAKKIIELAKKNKDIYLLTADTGFHVLDDFRQLFPDRFLNVGISEAAMISMASGLALSGKTVFTYAIAPFITMRCFEQIRIDLCYQNLPVKLIGVGEGLTYGTAGATHHSIEDIGIMSCLPNMTVICPGDPIEVERATEASLKLKGPCYLRIGKSGEAKIHSSSLLNFTIGKGIRLYRGKEIAIIATGNMLETATVVYKLLKQKGISSELISMHTVKPIDEKLIADISKKCSVIVSLEEHSVIGGLGSAISNLITERRLGSRLIKIALPDKYIDIVGEQDDLRYYYGLTATQISRKILRNL